MTFSGTDENHINVPKWETLCRGISFNILIFGSKFNVSAGNLTDQDKNSKIGNIYLLSSCWVAVTVLGAVGSVQDLQGFEGLSLY